jgi:hypothetical protein
MTSRTERRGITLPAGSSRSRRARLLSAVAAFALLIASVGHATATVVGGGGSSRTDCLAALDAPVNDPPLKPKNIRCVDGDPCDADGVVNGVCEFPISVCANSMYNPTVCTLNGVQTINVEHAADNGDPKFDPEFQALQNRLLNDIGPPTNTSDDCTNATNFHVAVIGPFAGVCKKNKKLLKLTTVSAVIEGRVYSDKDKIKMTCEPAPGGCDPLLLYGGTFDRIQTQIFNKSCAVSGCHDSQSQTGNLLLEVGASLTNLINVDPNNAAANALGWKRVTVTNPNNAGDPSTSLLVAKLKGPQNGFGARMPFNRPKLDKSLIDVVELWVAAGAPDTGWVPGTDQ